MIQYLSQKPKIFAWFFILVLYSDMAAPVVAHAAEKTPFRLPVSVITYKKEKGLLPASFHKEGIPYKNNILPSLIKTISASAAFSETSAKGPGQPEMQAFSSVNNSNMVDLFTGDFSYNIPLMDVGGYPLNLSYRSGITMDKEASWVGLGWNVNPGNISRNLRGLPDDFNGTDSVKKVSSIKENKTIGITVGGNAELKGLPLNVGASLGIFHNNYRGWGLETGLNASLNSGTGAKGPLSGGLSITNNSQEGLTIAPSFAINIEQNDAEDKSGIVSSFSTTLPYNSRSGLKGLQLSTGITQFKGDKTNQASSSWSSFISFASPSYTPSITLPFTARQYSFTAKVGTEWTTLHPNLFLSGYVAKQQIEPEDTLLALPAYGYLHYQEGAQNGSALLDFNREKEIIYREKPAVPHIAIPIYTYDAFSITGEGTGGMFRAYRGDIGFIHDHYIRTKDQSDRLSVDLGGGNLAHVGADLNINSAYTQNGPWLENNIIKNAIAFKKDAGDFEAAYFRNPGEKTVSSKQFYESIGGEDLVSVDLYQASPSSSTILATNTLTRYKNKRPVDKIILKPGDAERKERDKRSQVISYLNAKEASVAGFSKYIENYTYNQFDFNNCDAGNAENEIEEDNGLQMEIYDNKDLKGSPVVLTDNNIDRNLGRGEIIPGLNDNFSIRWSGRIKAPVTGTYIFTVTCDDGARFWLNDSLLINDWRSLVTRENKDTVNLTAGEFYKLKLEYFEGTVRSEVSIKWEYSGQAIQVIPSQYLYLPLVKDTFQIDSYLSKEKRENAFRKPNHISEITVLNNDGRRYIYGIPVYNLKQREASFSVNNIKGNKNTGLAGFKPGTDNTTNNRNGNEWYYNSEELPAYAHTFLLTGIVSSDYMDVTSNGISDDDLGDAIKFNYSKLSGIANPFKWRVPYNQDSVTYNEGLKTDSRDDKGSYVYGEKELWYLHSVISKSMVATFVLENRLDLVSMDEAGKKQYGAAKRLKEINLYNKADLKQNGTNARPIKTVHFEYNYELCQGANKPVNDTGKLTLKKIWFTYNGNDKGKENPYVFNYNNKNPNYTSKAYDRWGNYKDPLQNPGSVAGNIIDNAEYPYSLQDSLAGAVNCAAWTLDSINLPSGGSIKVDFESDDYAYVQNKRAMQLFTLAGLGKDSTLPSSGLNRLYDGDGENLYVYITIPVAVTSKRDIYYKYLTDINKLYFKLFAKMPSDQYGSGNEYISCYADLATDNAYGLINANTIWLKISGISLKGDSPGNYSPLAKAAIQFLRLNLPSKAYPGSEVGDDLDLDKAVKVLATMATNFDFSSFDQIARRKSWASEVDLTRTYIRLNNPGYKKYGGDLRVKRIKIYDNWDKMTAQKPALYGQEYIYTTEKEVDGIANIISSGVASYEPGIGGEENPFRIPIEYAEKIAPLGPVTLAYSEEPLGESFFPSPSVGYSKVRVRTINYKNKRSANGFEETRFYTACDFPVITDRSMLDPSTKKRYKPAISNFLRINAKHYISLSQGFKIELNDMHGKLRSQASYAETDPVHPIKYTENIYKTQSKLIYPNRLSNDAMVVHPDGSIDTSAIIGKDVEMMVDMREQQSVTNGYNVSVDADMFLVGIPPFIIIPSLLSLAQREENLYRSVAVMKVINRFGILDSVIQVDKGSKISTKDLLYDSETGDVLLTRTQNEFNDPVYNFNYPAHWAYDGMGMAYRNIDLTVDHITFRDGKITDGLPLPDSVYFSNGDEIVVTGKQQTGSVVNCIPPFSTFPAYKKVWAVDTSSISGGQKAIYFIDEEGKPYNGYDVSLKIIRSGRRNISAGIGTITSLLNPVVRNPVNNQYELIFDDTSQIVNASASEIKQQWSIEDRKNPKRDTAISILPCPEGYTYSPSLKTCIKDTVVIITDTFRVCLIPSQNEAYSINGSYIYSSFNIPNNVFTRSMIDIENPFWVNSTYLNYVNHSSLVLKNGLPSNLDMKRRIADSLNNNRYSLNSSDAFVIPPNNDGDSIGPMNRAGVWACPEIDPPANTWFGFTVPIIIPHTGWYFIGMAADNYIRVTIDSTLIREDNSLDVDNFKIWHIFPEYLTAGLHAFKMEGQDDGAVATGFGLEIYDNTEAELRDAADYADLNLIFSTKDIIGDSYPASYSCPVNYSLAFGEDSNFVCRSSIPATIDTTISRSCLSTVTDTAMNPFIAGLLGNWRVYRSYTYYNNRSETDPYSATDIRTNGSYSSFTPFWDFQSSLLQPQYDTSHWVWNSEITKFNRKGLEIENKDPLGRYNAGLYGYGETMPTAVVQNSQYQESAFEGFEDYSYSTQDCDTACPAARHIDYSAYTAYLTTSQKHTGKSSMKLLSGEDAALSFYVNEQDTTAGSLSFTILSDDCSPSGPVLSEIKTAGSVLLPPFSPLQGKKMLIAMWVKEEQNCNCSTYINNEIKVIIDEDGPDYTFHPSGNIIEGWQRYEEVFDIPEDAHMLTVSLRAMGESNTVYFDDLRIHPFNANMKSFVYNPVDLRLMAELDENNYATYYEYDDDGTLIRVKKETQRGIKTIRETRNALIKQ